MASSEVYGLVLSAAFIHCSTFPEHSFSAKIQLMVHLYLWGRSKSTALARYRAADACEAQECFFSPPREPIAAQHFFLRNTSQIHVKTFLSHPFGRLCHCTVVTFSYYCSYHSFLNVAHRSTDSSFLKIPLFQSSPQICIQMHTCRQQPAADCLPSQVNVCHCFEELYICYCIFYRWAHYLPTYY